MLKSVRGETLQIPGFKIIRKIGEGGMSVVYLAEQLSLKREVAIKVLKLEATDNDLDVQRFKQEAKTIAQLHHPNIISIFDIGQAKSGEVFFTMPYLNHGNFSTYQIDDEKEFIKLLQNICDGLNYAHNRGIIHRDIKPDNLIFDAFGNVKIADFGIALSKKSKRITQEHQIVGSAQYMSPEQARSLKVDFHSDIYSLGIVIYERLTGRVPFDSAEGIAVLVNHVSTPPPKLPLNVKHWQPLIDKCLAKEPKNRYQSMMDLKHALGKVPLNSIQKTNQSLYHLATHQNLKIIGWSVISILVVFAIGTLALKGNNSTDQEVANPQPVIDLNIKENTQEERGFSQISVSTEPINPKPREETQEHQQAQEQKKDQAKEQNTESDPLIDNYTLNETVDSDPSVKINTVALTTLKAEIETFSDVSELTPVKKPFQELNEASESLPAAYFIQNSSQETEGQTDEVFVMQDPTDQSAFIDSLLDQASENIEKYYLIRPSDNNATDQFMQVLAMDPENVKALEGLELVDDAYRKLIISSISRDEFDRVLTHSQSLGQFYQQTGKDLEDLQNFYLALPELVEKQQLSYMTLSVENTVWLVSLAELVGDESFANKMTRMAESTKSWQKANKVFTQLKMNWLPLNNQVSIHQTEITRDQYALFVSQTGRESSKCKHKGGSFISLFSSKSWESPHFEQTAKHPVVCVSAMDAEAFAQWLSSESGLKVSLPNESQWKQVSARESSPFQACKTANVSDEEAAKLRNKDENFACNDGYMFTAPVASFAANGMGVHDIQGNVSEWVYGCETTPCSSFLAVGSSWFDGVSLVNEYAKDKIKEDTGYSYIGFRLVLENL